jgi:hypothetical protein
MLSELADASLQRGEKEVSPEIVEVYASVLRAAASCHNAFRTRA